MRLSPRIIIAVVVALLAAVSYYSSRSTNEVTGEVQHVSISPDQEAALGLQAVPDMTQQFGGELDHPMNDYVESVGQRVVRQSDAASGPYKYDFHLLADPETINAFALPGGQVFITLGLLRKLTSEAELAGVLGHEVGHVVGRHGAEHLAKQQLTAGLVGAVGVATYDPENPAASQQRAAMAAAVAQMVNMKYGRADELESDALGVRFMSAAGYDARGMIRLMQVLAEGAGSRQPEFFSTHPNPENRMERLQALISENQAGGDLGEERFRDAVLRHMR
ncbi:MAG: M48 family metalloprotease [Gemmatimonadaceae bacterium]